MYFCDFQRRVQLLKSTEHALLLIGLLTMSTICLLLGMHLDVQDEISRELDEIFGEDTRDATPDDVMHMHCLARVIKEALR